jgi:hypothetical protein
MREISSKLRVHTPAFGDIGNLLAFLRAPFNSYQNHTSFEIAAPLPFSMICSDPSVLVVKASRQAIEKMQVIGFFDNGRANLNHFTV